MLIFLHFFHFTRKLKKIHKKYRYFPKNACNLCMENTGDCLGKICIWYDISSNAEKINRELNKKELKND